MARLVSIIVLLAGISSIEAGTLFDGNLWNDLRVHWSPLGALGGFWSMPRNYNDAKAQGYTHPPEEDTVCATGMEILCPDKDPTVCILYDKRGNIAGMEISVVRKVVDGKFYAFDQRPMFRAKTRFGHEVHVTTLFFVEQNVINNGGRQNMTAHGTGTGLWMQSGPDRSQLFEVPRIEKEVTAKTLYTKENCIPAMGTHYYYNISESLACEDFHPIFGLYKKGELIGFGYQIFGKIPPIGKNWFENVPSLAIKPTIPNAPKCLVEKVDAYGVVSLHVYFVDNPWLISCIF